MNRAALSAVPAAALTATITAMLLAGCSAEQAYNAAQGWQRNQCNALPDKAEADRCLGRAGAATPYETYRKETEKQ